jgi:Protein of unknown function (DUF3102)
MSKSRKTQASNLHVPEVVISSFDYGLLLDEQRRLVEQKTSEIRDRLKRSAQDIWEIGESLCEVRLTLKHGQFDAWLKAEFGWSRRTAYNFINVYESFGSRANLTEINIATSALYLLAAPSTPDTVRQSVIDEAKKSGDRLAHKDIAERLKPKSSDPKVLDVEATEVPTRRPEILRILPNPNLPPLSLKAGTWYGLGDRHHLFPGDTSLPTFINYLPAIQLAIAITDDAWDHDWLVDTVDSLVVLPPERLQLAQVEQLILMLTQPGETVLFPWLPDGEMIALGDRLGRLVYAGDPEMERCHAAARAMRLPIAQI